jgi:uncharacterized protein YdeI (BOF family)
MSTERPIRRSRLKLTIAAVALVAAGGAAGAFALAETRASVTMAPATPIAIRSLASDGIVTIRGRVAEVYGNKFVIADATGRALVDTGPEGEDGLVKVSDPVTIQGRFDHGFVHAAFLVTPDGKVTALGPLDRPGPGRHGKDHRADERGAGDRRDGPALGTPPAPAAPAASAAH